MRQNPRFMLIVNFSDSFSILCIENVIFRRGYKPIRKLLSIDYLTKKRFYQTPTCLIRSIQQRMTSRMLGRNSFLIRKFETNHDCPLFFHAMPPSSIFTQTLDLLIHKNTLLYSVSLVEGSNPPVIDSILHIYVRFLKNNGSTYHMVDHPKIYLEIISPTLIEDSQNSQKFRSLNDRLDFVCFFQNFDSTYPNLYAIQRLA
jgi:hypothetical protein